MRRRLAIEVSGDGSVSRSALLQGCFNGVAGHPPLALGLGCQLGSVSRFRDVHTYAIFLSSSWICVLHLLLILERHIWENRLRASQGRKYLPALLEHLAILYELCRQPGRRIDSFCLRIPRCLCFLIRFLEFF